MTFVAPQYFFASLMVAAAIVGLHFIVTRRPPAVFFPTTRFVPESSTTTRAVNRRVEDLLLLLLRISAVILTGAAFAKPAFQSHRVSTLQVVIADRSRVVTNPNAIVDSANAATRHGAKGVLVLFDSVPLVIRQHISDSLRHFATISARGSLSAALVSAIHVAAQLRDQADSIELTVISPIAAEEIDAAVDSISHLWPGRIRVVRVGDESAQPTLNIASPPTIRWPLDGHAPGTLQRATIDTVFAVAAGDIAVVAPFVRQWRFDTNGTRVVARWIDGEPAAIERITEGQPERNGAMKALIGCEHDVAIPTSGAPDLILRRDFNRLRTALSSRCGSADSPTLSARARNPFDTESSRSTRVATEQLTRSDAAPPSIASAWLLVVAILILTLELWVRRGRFSSLRPG